MMRARIAVIGGSHSKYSTEVSNDGPLPRPEGSSCQSEARQETSGHSPEKSLGRTGSDVMGRHLGFGSQLIMNLAIGDTLWLSNNCDSISRHSSSLHETITQDHPTEVVCNCWTQDDQMSRTQKRRVAATYWVFQRLSCMHFLLTIIVCVCVQPSVGMKVYLSEVLGVLHQKAILRCNYSDHKGAVNLVLWRRAKHFDTVFQFVDIGAVRHEGPLNAFQKRKVTGNLNRVDQYHELIIDDPQHFDEIDYICEIFTASSYGTAIGRLTLIEPRERDPEVTYLKNSEETYMPLKTFADTSNLENTTTKKETGSIRVSGKVILTCHAYKSLPHAKVTWHITDKSVKWKPTTVIRNIGEIEKSIEIEVVKEASVECSVRSPRRKPNVFFQNIISIKLYSRDTDPENEWQVSTAEVVRSISIVPAVCAAITLHLNLVY